MVICELWRGRDWDGCDVDGGERVGVRRGVGVV